MDVVRRRGACLQHGAEKPTATLRAAPAAAGMRVALYIVAQDERGARRSPALAAYLLARAEGLDHDPIRQHDRARAPDRPFADRVGIVSGEEFVFGQLAFDVLKMGAGLQPRIGEDPDIRLASFYR